MNADARVRVVGLDASVVFCAHWRVTSPLVAPICNIPSKATTQLVPLCAVAMVAEEVKCAAATATVVLLLIEYAPLKNAPEGTPNLQRKPADAAFV